MTPTNDEIRAQVIAAILAGGAVNEVSRKYKLSAATVSRIKSSLSTETLQHIATDKREKIDDLLLSAMADNIRALGRIAETTIDTEYLKKQGAVACAALYAEIAGVTLRLLEAASAAGIGEPAESD
jgi:hypothetical protein